MRRFQLLTRSNLPDINSSPPYFRHLGIILDEQLIAFPRLMTTIGDSGRITGSFTQDEVDFLVGILRAGTLPVPLEKIPLSESQVDPSQTQRQWAVTAMGVTLGVLLVSWLMILLRGGVIGVGGALASLLQVLFTASALELIRATVTLPVVIAAATVCLVNVVGVVLVCASIRRARLAEDCHPGVVRRGTFRCFVPAVIVLACVWSVGTAAYVLGTFPIRSVGIPLVIGSTVALVALCTCMVAPWVLWNQEPAHDIGQGEWRGERV